MRITPWLLVPFSLVGCATLTPVSGTYSASPLELVSNSCETDLDVDTEAFELSVSVDAGADSVAIQFDDGTAFSCELGEDLFDCNELTILNSDDRADITITYSWHLQGAFLSETSIAPLTFTSSASCEGEDCDSLVDATDMPMPCAVVLQSTAELK